MLTQVDELARIALEITIAWLKETREIGTKYRPQPNTFKLDAHLMARVLRHNGNMKAQLSLAEIKFYQKIIEHLKNKGFKAIFENAEFFCQPYNKSCLKVEMRYLKKPIGRFPVFLKKEEEVYA